jgi:hypothetical protein
MDIEDDIARLRESGISRTKAAQALGIEKWRLDALIDALKIEWKPNLRGGSFEINGVVKTLASHSETLGLTPSGLRHRLEKGIDLTAPPAYTQVTPEEAAAFVDLRISGVAAWDAAQQLGRPYPTLNKAAKRFVPGYEDMMRGVPRIRRSPDEIEKAA